MIETLMQNAFLSFSYAIGVVLAIIILIGVILCHNMIMANYAQKKMMEAQTQGLENMMNQFDDEGKK